MDAGGRARARRVERFDQIVLSERTLERPDPARAGEALAAFVRDRGLAVLPWSEHRVAAARQDRIPAQDGRRALARCLRCRRCWTTRTGSRPCCSDRSALSELEAQDLENAVRGRLDPALVRRLDSEAPDRFLVPTGTAVPIDYAAEGGPRAEVRVQELFGLARHPMLAGGRAPLVLALLSPARRPVQVTADLPAFWAGLLEGGPIRDARPLPEASLARRPARRPADHPRQAAFSSVT